MIESLTVLAALLSPWVWGICFGLLACRYCFCSEKSYRILHNWELTHDSSEEFFKDGRMPLRLPTSGFRRYKCSDCGKTKITEWSAYD